MITLSVGQLAGLLAMAGAAVGLAVLAICVWRITGKLDGAYDDGWQAALATSPQPAPAAATGPLRPLPDIRPAGSWVTGEIERIRARGQAIVAGLALDRPPASARP